MSVCWPASTISIRLTVFTEWTLWRVWDELAPALVALLARATLRGTKGNMVCPLYASASVPVRCGSDVVHEAKVVVGFGSRSRPTYLQVRTSAPGPPGRRCFEPFSRSLSLPAARSQVPNFVLFEYAYPKGLPTQGSPSYRLLDQRLVKLVSSLGPKPYASAWGSRQRDQNDMELSRVGPVQSVPLIDHHAVNQTLCGDITSPALCYTCAFINSA